MSDFLNATEKQSVVFQSGEWVTTDIDPTCIPYTDIDGNVTDVETMLNNLSNEPVLDDLSNVNDTNTNNGLFMLDYSTGEYTTTVVNSENIPTSNGSTNVIVGDTTIQESLNTLDTEINNLINEPDQIAIDTPFSSTNPNLNVVNSNSNVNEALNLLDQRDLNSLINVNTDNANINNEKYILNNNNGVFELQTLPPQIVEINSLTDVNITGDIDESILISDASGIYQQENIGNIDVTTSYGTDTLSNTLDNINNNIHNNLVDMDDVDVTNNFVDNTVLAKDGTSLKPFLIGDLNVTPLNALPSDTLNNTLTNLENIIDSKPTTLEQMLDTTLTTPVNNNDVLIHDGTQWINDQLTAEEVYDMNSNVSLIPTQTINDSLNILNNQDVWIETNSTDIEYNNGALKFGDYINLNHYDSTPTTFKSLDSLGNVKETSLDFLKLAMGFSNIPPIPMDLSLVKGWYDFSDKDNTTVVDGRITSVTDKSGNWGNLVLGTSGGASPGAILSENTALFTSGDNAYYEVSANFIHQQPFTVVTSIRFDYSGGQNYFLGQNRWGTSSGSLHVGLRNNSQFTFALYANDITIPYGNLADGNFHVLSIVFTRPGVELYVDGTLVSSSATIPTAAGLNTTGTNLTIGGFGVDYDQFRGAIKQLAILDGSNTTEDRQKTEYLIGQAAGLTLDATHPFVNGF